MKIQLITHADKRSIEFAVQIFHDGILQSTHFPKKCGHCCRVQYPSTEFTHKRKHHANFDFELLCYNLDPKHREIENLSLSLQDFPTHLFNGVWQ